MPPKAVLETLERIWGALEPLGLPMALAGGLALAVWKHVRATQDVDLLVAVSPGEIERLLAAVRAAGFRTKRTPPTIALGPLDLLPLEFDPEDSFVTVEADLLLVDSEYHRQALERRVSISLAELGRPITVLSCEDLLLHKLMAGRLIDLADAAALLRANQRTIDEAYLEGKARQLRLTADLDRIRAEAFPGDNAR